jgi:hypothetical protein
LFKIGQFEKAKMHIIINEPNGASIRKAKAPLKPAFEKILHHKKSFTKNSKNNTSPKIMKNTTKIGAITRPESTALSIIIPLSKKDR